MTPVSADFVSLTLCHEVSFCRLWIPGLAAYRAGGDPVEWIGGGVRRPTTTTFTFHVLIFVRIAVNKNVLM